MSDKAKLPLHGMAHRHPALISPIAEYYCQAASVCLNRHHIPPTHFDVDDSSRLVAAEVEWEQPDERVQRAWANETDTTEAGAYACVLAAVELMTGMVAVRRAETATGADYYIGPPGAGEEDLEDCFRLEVSGLDRGSKADVFSRLNRKVEQAQRGRSNLPAIAGVIGFLEKEIRLAPVTTEES
jgi:hypothetical protein